MGIIDIFVRALKEHAFYVNFYRYKNVDIYYTFVR